MYAGGVSWVVCDGAWGLISVRGRAICLSPVKVRFPIIFCSAVALLVTVAYLEANNRTLDFTNRRAGVVENKRVEKKIWAQPQGNSMANKRFPIEQWDKHFSSVGSKRASIAMQENQEKQMFRTETLDRTEVNFEMSRWNERMADLHKRAGIEMDDRARLVSDQQLYSAMLQDTQQFKEMGDQVSLRDLNRYQFRRNRSDVDIPVNQAGSGE